jgi:hypothetical protein
MITLGSNSKHWAESMMKETRRFTVGENVMVRRDDPSPFAGLPAVIEDIQPNDRGVAVLDRYIVVFTWGEKQAFYEPQLEPRGR